MGLIQTGCRNRGCLNLNRPATQSERLIFSATSSRADCLLALITTEAPSFANRSAVAAPTPELPPVMTATLPCKCFSIVFPPKIYYFTRTVYHFLTVLSTWKHCLGIVLFPAISEGLTLRRAEPDSIVSAVKKKVIRYGIK